METPSGIGVKQSSFGYCMQDASGLLTGGPEDELTADRIATRRHDFHN